MQDLRSILDNFCFKLTDVQFKEFLKSINTIGSHDTTVDYEDLLGMAKDPNAMVWILLSFFLFANILCCWLATVLSVFDESPLM